MRCKTSLGSRSSKRRKANIPAIAKLLRGFGSGVLELVDDADGDTYRAVYVVRFPAAVYVVHAFQKKARRGIKTPRGDFDLIRARLNRATAMEAAQQVSEGE